MTTDRAVRWAVLVALIPLGGCVDRRFVIESNVPNATVYINNQYVGAAPAHAAFEYYGYYNITIVHPGYETLNVRQHVVAPWYAYPPLDFITEVLLPYRIRDVRRYPFELTAARQIRTDELINSADALRDRGDRLPPATAAPINKPAPPPTPVLGAPVGGVPTEGATPLPSPTPVPGSPLLPSVTP